MVSTTKLDRTEKLGITLPLALLQKIESERGDIPRSIFIRRASYGTRTRIIVVAMLAF